MKTAHLETRRQDKGFCLCKSEIMTNFNHKNRKSSTTLKTTFNEVLETDLSHSVYSSFC